ncbi:PLP-dependent aminotransferase family protein [Luteibacter sp. PPL201]|uniref:PLP-dependent aminotransferase family protein n=1 Tax=Luteibacter sahnii TaxID=3021977 RepID=A0ABT6BFS0_9GAMM
MAVRLEVMNFLNEMAERFPAAISFASGRPAEGFFDMRAWIESMHSYEEHLAEQRGTSRELVERSLAQYGATAGIIRNLISRQLRVDEGIDVASDRILVTVGCQEALDICVRTLCRDEDDVLLARSPTYIGITGAAYLGRAGIVSFREAEGLGLVAALEKAIESAHAQGKRPRALYLIPDFDNPTGEVIDLHVRRAILALCALHDILVLEDNPYGMFRYEGTPVPTMRSLDDDRRVIYVGTFSKTLCPALRVGYAVVPQRAVGRCDLMEAMVQAKSFVSVNTSQFAQAVVGGVLMSQRYSLRDIVSKPLAHYRRNRDEMLDALDRHFADLRSQVHWNRPEGGFFLVVELPFDFGDEHVKRCAEAYGVLVMPLRYFALDSNDGRRVRLAFSNTSPEKIRDGISRFSRFVHDHLDRKGASG